MFQLLVSLLPDMIPLFGGATPVHSSAEGLQGGLPSWAVRNGAALRVPPFAEDTLLTLERALGLARRAGPVCSQWRKCQAASISHPHHSLCELRLLRPSSSPRLSDDNPPGSAQRHLAGVWSGRAWWLVAPTIVSEGKPYPPSGGKFPPKHLVTFADTTRCYGVETSLASVY